MDRDTAQHCIAARGWKPPLLGGRQNRRHANRPPLTSLYPPRPSLCWSKGGVGLQHKLSSWEYVRDRRNIPAYVTSATWHLKPVRDATQKHDSSELAATSTSKTKPQTREPSLHHPFTNPLQQNPTKAVETPWIAQCSWLPLVTRRQCQELISQESHYLSHPTKGMVFWDWGNRITERMPTFSWNTGHFSIRWHSPNKKPEVQVEN